MKYLILVFAALVLSSPAAAQHDREYKSSELSKNSKKMRKISESYPGLPSQEEVLAFRSPYCTIGEVDDYSPYEESKMHRMPYRDSINRVIEEQERLGDDTFYLTRLWRDTIGGVYRYNIIKYECRDSLAAFIYTSYEYSDLFYTGSTLWIAFSENNAKSWKHYFTGLYHGHPIDPKWYSKLPLFRDDKTLQIEGALIRMTEFGVLPVGAKFELAKDGIVISFDMDRITWDSDGDGLTDIVEAKFRTDPNNKDTNGNGIPDDLDLNPRHNAPRTEQTIVFETILDKWFEPVDSEEFERVMALPDSLRSIEAENKRVEWQDIEPCEPTVAQADPSTQTVLIISDDESIKAVQPKYVRVIILSPEEYIKSSDAVFKTELKDMFLSPMCRVNRKKDLYIIESANLPSGETYLVQKTENGWRIKVISGFII